MGHRVGSCRSFSVVFVRILATIIIFAPSLSAEEQHRWSFHSEMDLYLGLKVGAEYRISDDWGLRGSIGACVISPLMTTYTLVGVKHLRGPESPLQLDLQFGLIQAIFNVLEPAVDLDPTIDTASAYWVPGAGASIGYRFDSGRVLAVRVGAGCLFGYDLERWQGPSFQPNIAIEYDVRPRR
jgi:hypothetical protein